MKNVTEQGYSLTAVAEREIALDVKEKLCYIASDYDTVLQSTLEIDKEKTYVLPDGNINTVAPNCPFRGSVAPAKVHR